MTGQVVCSIGNTFGFLVTTKFAQSWFPESQRALANSIALSSSTFGLLIGSLLSPIIVNNGQHYVSQMSKLNITFCVLSFLPVFLAAFIKSSIPPSPPYLVTIDDNKEHSKQSSKLRERFCIYLQQMKKMLSNKEFLLLLLAFSIVLGIFNAILTLVQQIFCVRGYTNDEVGMFGSLVIGK